MISLRDVSKPDTELYDVWQNDSKLKGYLSRLSPNDSSVAYYDKSRVCWYIIVYDSRAIGAVWLEKDRYEADTVILGIFISSELDIGKGIGIDAIKEAIRVSIDRMPFKHVRLNVRKSNHRAICCYEKCGFKIHDEGSKVAQDGTLIEFYKMLMEIDERSTTILID